MSINFNIGDILVVQQSYVIGTLQNTTLSYLNSSRAENVSATLSILGLLNHTPCEVLNKGTIDTYLDNKLTLVTRSYITVVPQDTQSPVYNAGDGVNIYWEDDETINNMFELSTAYLSTLQFNRALNSTGSTLAKGKLVRVTGFSTTSQVPTIALADATTTTNSVVFGILVADILDGQIGTVLTNGHYQGVDTSSFLLNGTVFLSDTPGGISNAAGTVTSILGRVVNAPSVSGAFYLQGVIPLGSGGGGSGGSTGLQGVTGLRGLTGIQGLTGLIGNTGSAGTGVTGEGT